MPLNQAKPLTPNRLSVKILPEPLTPTQQPRRCKMSMETFVEQLRGKPELAFIIACPLSNGNRLSREGMDRLDELGGFIDRVSGETPIDAMASEDPACREGLELLAQGQARVFNWTLHEGDDEFNAPDDVDDAGAVARIFDEAVNFESGGSHHLLIVARPASINNWLNYKRQARRLPAGGMTVYDTQNDTFYWPLG